MHQMHAHHLINMLLKTVNSVARQDGSIIVVIEKLTAFYVMEAISLTIVNVVRMMTLLNVRMNRVQHTQMLMMMMGLPVVNCMNAVTLIYVSTVIPGVQMVTTVTGVMDMETVVGAIQEEKNAANAGKLMTARIVNQTKRKLKLPVVQIQLKFQLTLVCWRKITTIQEWIDEV